MMPPIRCSRRALQLLDDNDQMAAGSSQICDRLRFLAILGRQRDHRGVAACSLPVSSCDRPPDVNPPIFSDMFICGLDELGCHSARGVSHVLSLLDPDWPEPTAFWAFDPHARATLHFHDAIEPAPDIVLPQRADVETILTFSGDLGDDLRHLLIHCHAGISRSTAAMAMILAQAFPHEAEDAIVDRLLRIRPQAWPNSRMIRFADELLGHGGRLSAAVNKVYARRLAATWIGNGSARRPKARIEEGLHRFERFQLDL